MVLPARHGRGWPRILAKRHALVQPAANLRVAADAVLPLLLHGSVRRRLPGSAARRDRAAEECTRRAGGDVEAEGLRVGGQGDQAVRRKQQPVAAALHSPLLQHDAPAPHVHLLLGAAAAAAHAPAWR